MNVISYLNENSGAIQAISTVVLVGVTIYYALQTRNTVKAMERTEEIQTRPQIAVFLRQRDNNLSLIDLVIINHGNGLAKDIKFQVQGTNFNLDPVHKNKTIKSVKVLNNGIKTLGPGQEYQAWLMSVIGRVDELQKTKTYVLVSYTNSDGKKQYSDRYKIDFNSLPEYQLGKPVEYRVAESLEKASKYMEKIARKLK